MLKWCPTLPQIGRDGRGRRRPVSNGFQKRSFSCGLTRVDPPVSRREVSDEHRLVLVMADPLMPNYYWHGAPRTGRRPLMLISLTARNHAVTRTLGDPLLTQGYQGASSPSGISVRMRFLACLTRFCVKWPPWPDFRERDSQVADYRPPSAPPPDPESRAGPSCMELFRRSYRRRVREHNGDLASGGH